MTTLNLTMYCDPGHGWLQVSVSSVFELGIEHAISRYSYIDPAHNWAYLEEDLDAGTFMDKAKASGWTVNFQVKHLDEDTIIRRFARWPHTIQSYVDRCVSSMCGGGS